MKLWFRNSEGDMRLIANCETVDNISDAIAEFIADCNARKPAGARPFVSYYTRIYREGKYLKYDIGSHSEFFLLETDKDWSELYG